MEWTFTGEQVVKGEVNYSLEDFRQDFYAEVKDNFPEYGPQDLNTMYRLAYDICYCTAARRDLADLLEHCRGKGIKADLKYLELIRDSNLANIAMMKAIFARMVSDFMNEGFSSEEALKKLDEVHRNSISES